MIWFRSSLDSLAFSFKLRSENHPDIGLLYDLLLLWLIYMSIWVSCPIYYLILTFSLISSMSATSGDDHLPLCCCRPAEIDVNSSPWLEWYWRILALKNWWWSACSCSVYRYLVLYWVEKKVWTINYTLLHVRCFIPCFMSVNCWSSAFGTVIRNRLLFRDNKVWW